MQTAKRGKTAHANCWLRKHANSPTIYAMHANHIVNRKSITTHQCHHNISSLPPAYLVCQVILLFCDHQFLE